MIPVALECPFDRAPLHKKGASYGCRYCRGEWTPAELVAVWTSAPNSGQRRSAAVQLGLVV